MVYLKVYLKLLKECKLFSLLKSRGFFEAVLTVRAC